MRQYLVTGGAGFIGSHIVSALLQQGAAVRVLDDFSTGKEDNLRGVQDSSMKARLEVIRGDLRDPAVLMRAAAGVEVIFHEAAFISVPQSMQAPQECFDVNVTGTSLLLEAARSAGVRRVVLASSAAIYGDTDELPLSENAKPRPLSPYAASKLVDETYAQLYTNAFLLPVVALRYFNVYGPRQRPDTQYAAAVPIFIRRMLAGMPVTVFGDGGQTRDLIYVGDVVKANLAAAESAEAPGRVFNVCTGRSTRILDLLAALDHLIPNAPKPTFEGKRQGDIYASLGSPQAAEDILGFRAETSLLEGLKATVEWMRQGRADT